jgi:hypothetical protein
MTQEQVFEIGRIMLAGQNLKVGEAIWLWLPDTGHFFEGYITFRDGDTAHVWVRPFTEKLRRPDGPLDPDDPHTQIAFWNGVPGIPISRSRPTTIVTLIAMDCNDLRAVLCRLDVPEHDEESLRDRLGVPLPYYDHGRHDFGPV